MKAKYIKKYGAVEWTGKPRSFLGLPINFTRYFITDKKLVVKTGFLTVHENQIELYRILDLSLYLPITQRIFGCGTIKVSAKDVNLPQIDLKQLRHPHEIYNLLEKQIENQKRSYGVLGRDIIGASMNVGQEGDDDCDGDHCDFDGDGDGIPDHLQ